MIGDIIIIEEIHRKKSGIILPEIIKRYNNKKFIVTISGISGTGKTEIASVIQHDLFYKHGLRAKQIHLDDYYKTDFHSRNNIRKETGIIGKDEISWKKLEKVVRKFRSNDLKLYVQRIHRFLDDVEYCISPNRKIDILIVEGLYGSYLSDKDFSVYLDGNIEDTYKFRKLRGKENPDDDFRRTVLEKESNCVVQSKKLSDLIIPFSID